MYGTQATISSEIWTEFLQNLTNPSALAALKAIHLNDSLNDRGSHKDRHARIGEGYIGWEAFTGLSIIQS